jgi:hypothetical protein
MRLRGCLRRLLFFLPDTPHWYYARNRHADGDAMLIRLNDAPIESHVQQTKQEVLLAIEVELEANASLHLKQFVMLELLITVEDR